MVDSHGSKGQVQAAEANSCAHRIADPIPSVTNAAVVSILVSVTLVLPYSSSDPGRRLRSLRTARTLVNSGGGDLESVLGSHSRGFESASYAAVTRGNAA
jgi:hypothetical protein